MTRIKHFVAGLCLLLITSGVSAEQVQLRLCTASAAGNYYMSGQEISRQVKRRGIDIDVLETSGSMDNLQKIAVAECDAGIVQIDAYLVYQDAHSDDRLDIKRPLHLYDEYVHLVCNRESGIDSIKDLRARQDGRALLIGPDTSGGAITWDSFTLQASDYAGVATENIGGKEALDRVAEGSSANCMLYVSGLRSEYSSNIDQSGDGLRLATVDDKDLNKTKFAGKPIYSFQKIPAEAYPRLQADGGEVLTLTVRAILVVSSAWASTFPNSFQRLSDGVDRALPEIVRRVSTP